MHLKIATPYNYFLRSHFFFDSPCIFVAVCEGDVWLCAGGEVVVVAGTKRGWDRLQGDTHSQLLALKQGGLPSLCQVGAALTIPPSPARVMIC